MEQMNQNLLSRVLEFLRRKMWNKRWQRVATCLSAVAVFGVTYALILPAVTATRSYPTLSAEELSAWSGDELTAFVNAENTEDSGEKVIVLTAEGEGADLSDLYEFNNEGVCVVTDKSGAEIELHRVVRAEDTNKNRVFYWFRLEAGQETSLALDLADRQDASRFAQTVEAVKEAAKENKEAEAENTASASDAPKAAAAAAGAKKSTASATASNAGSRGTASNAVSGDDIAQANAYAKSEEEKIQTETDDDGFVQISDGAVVDDRPDSEKAEDQEVAETEIVASLKLSAGSGETFDDAVKDADKNADKRGDAQLTFTWKDVTLQDAEIAHPDLSTELDDGTTFTVFYDRTAGIPADAVLTVTEIGKDSDSYAEYFAKTGAAVTALEDNAGLGLRDARIYDVRIENAEEDLVDILTPVRLMVTYADAMSIDEESSINLVSFNTYEPRAYSPGAVEGGDEIAALSFTADASAVYAVAEVGTLEAKVLTADGAGYNVTVSYGIDAHIPKGATLEVSEIPADSPEYEEYRSLAENAAVRAAGEEVGTARLFDIAIMYEGREVQPDVPVDVRIDFDDSIEKAEEEEFRMVHLGEGSTDVLDVSLQGDLKESGMDVDGVMFSTDGFSKFMLTGLLMKAPALTVSGEQSIIKNFTTEIFYGGEWKNAEKIWDGNAYVDYGKEGYVWTAPSSAAGHRFNFRISFGLSVPTGADDVVFPENTVEIRVPKSVLKDRNGQQADYYEMSIPSKADVEEAAVSGEVLDQDISFAWYEDGDEIVLYNFRDVDNGFDGFIEMSYLTEKVTFDYMDMTISDPYWATITAKNPTDPAAPAEEETTKNTDKELTFIVDTQVELLAMEDRIPTKYDKWQDSWGQKPEGADGYMFFVWEVRSRINDNSQMYNFTIQDFLSDLKATSTRHGEADPDVLQAATKVFGYRFSGESVYTAADENGSATQLVQTANGLRYDYVLTGFKTDVWGKYDHWEMVNNTTVTVDPYDQLDPDSVATYKRKFTFNIPTFDGGGGGGWGGWVRADGWYRYATLPEHEGRIPRVYYTNLGMVAGDYSRYDLQELVNEPGKGRVGMRDFLDNLDYAVHMEGYPMPWTRASNSDATQPPQPDQYFVEPVTYVLTNDTFYGYDEHNDLSSKVLLNSDDYQIDSIAFNMNCVDREYNPSTAAFDRNKKLEYMDGEAVTIYGQFGSGSDFVEIAKYDMKTRTFTQLNADYIDTGKTYGGTDAKIVFKEDMGCTGYRMETTNKHYYTRFANVPNLRIKYKEGGNHITELVKFGAEATESIGIEDVATMQIYDYKEELKKEYSAGGESGVDYVRIVEKESVLEKNATATRNNTKKRQYTITWKLHMEETMRMGMDTVEAVGQNSGIFYDLLPIGSVFDANPDSIVIRTDEGDLSASQYRIIQHENYKDSGRTLLEIQIFADAKFYDIYYDTVHPYESLKDYGNIVVNPIVYKTGNPTIANGHPDEAQYYKDDMSDENKTYLTDIDEDGTVDPNSRQYIDNEKIFDIAAITAAATGLSKKVRSASSSNYGSEATVKNNASYVYRLRYQNTNSGISKKVIFYDSLESYEDKRTRDWHGVLEGVDFSALPTDPQTGDPLVAPKLYISKTAELDVRIEENRDLNDEDTWTYVADPVSAAGKSQLQKARAIAIDLSETPSGEEYIVPKLGSLTVILYMKSPNGAERTNEKEGTVPPDELEEGYPETYNTVYVNRTTETDTQIIPDAFAEAGSYVTVKLVVSADVNIKKVGNPDLLPIPGISFRIQGTSAYGTRVDRIDTTDRNGNLTFRDIEKGDNYILTEYETTPDWLRNEEQFKVEVTAQGEVKINGELVGQAGYEIKNDPRIHGDLEFLKRREPTPGDTSVVPVPNVTFKLEGTSEYGNDIYKIATPSSAEGRVFFGDIEKGQEYHLKEIQTTDDYVLNPNDYIVKVDEFGNVTVWLDGEEVDKDGLIPLIFNKRKYWDFSFRKVDADNTNRWLEGAEFQLSGGDLAAPIATMSNAGGRVIFTHLKAGTYILKETKAPTGVDKYGRISENGNLNYQPDDKEHIVVIGEDGSVTIEGLEKNENFEYIVKDPRSMDGEIIVYKKWVDDDPSGRPIPKIVMTVDDPESMTYRGITVVKEWVGDFRDLRDQTKTVITLLRKSTETETGETLIDWIGNTGTATIPTDFTPEEGKTYTITASYENSDGTEAVYPAVTAGEELKLFLSGGENLKGKLYSFRLKEDDVLKMDLVPAVKNGTYGMYDLLKSKFYYAPEGSGMTGAPAQTALETVVDSTNLSKAEWDRSTDEENFWTLKFPDIVVDGKYTYYVYESTIPDGYTSTSGTEETAMPVVGGGAEIANRYTSSWDFPFNGTYTYNEGGQDGTVREWTVPGNGTYTLQVWGANGGDDSNAGGIGGYSEGTINLKKGQKLYIFSGGRGGSKQGSANGGWNGGGTAGNYGSSGGGGGMTHISYTNNLVDNASKTTNKARAENMAWNPEGTLIVAGGGGGGGNVALNNVQPIGGVGGGKTGGEGNTGKQATQTSGFAQGFGENRKPDSGPTLDGGAGGAGWYGGYAPGGDNGGGGGSGFVDTTLTNAKTIRGNAEDYPSRPNNDVNGYARITLISEEADGQHDLPDPTHVDPVLPSYQYETEDDKWDKQVDANTWKYVFHVFNDNAMFGLEELDGDNVAPGNNLTAAGYVADYYTTTIDGSKVKSAVFTNRKESDYGRLKITKVVEDLEDSTQSFDMTLTLTGEKINTSGTQIIGGEVFQCSENTGSTGGKAVKSFSLKDGESYELSDIPKDTHYEVTEAKNANFRVTYDNYVSGTIVAKEVAETTVTNTYNPPKVKTMPVVLKKVVTGKSESDTSDEEFNFSVSFSNLAKDLEYRYQVSSDSNAVRTERFMSGESGDATITVTLKDGESAAFMDIPEGATYRITELAGDWLASFRIEDAASDKSGHSIAQSTGENTSKDTDLSTAEETAEAGPGENGEVEKITVTFTNKIENYQTLKVVKQVEMEEGYEIDPTEAFTVTVKFSGLSAGTVIRGENTGNWTVGTGETEVEKDFLLRHGQSETFTYVPAGAYYTITEASSNYIASYEFTDTPDSSAPDGYKPVFVKRTDSNAVTNRRLATALESVNRYENATLTFTNRQQLAPVIIRKTVVSNITEDKQKEFSFTMQAPDMGSIKTPGGQYVNGEATKEGYVIFNSGIWNFTLKNGEAAVVWMPVGTAFTVTETTAEDHFLTTYKVGTGRVQTGTAASSSVNAAQNKNRIDFTNTRYNIRFRKTDLKDNLLNDAKFQLNRQDSSGKYVSYISELTIGEGTQILMPGKYQMVEKSAPTGFIVGGEFKFTVTDDGGVILDGNNPKDRVSTASDAGQGDIIVITVKNEPGSALPKTGGPGTILYTVSGLMLLAAAAFMFKSRMNRSR